MLFVTIRCPATTKVVLTIKKEKNLLPAWVAKVVVNGELWQYVQTFHRTYSLLIADHFLLTADSSLLSACI